MNFTTLGYLFASFVTVYFFTLVLLLFRNDLCSKKVARGVAIIASILWGVMMPLSLIVGFVGAMGSGAPGTKVWVVLFPMFSFLMLFLLSFYSITNVWIRYKSDNYKQVVLVALAPFFGIFLSVPFLVTFL